MLRSMSSAISGLKNHQIAMDVVGHNIANVNTVGFKSSRTNFKEALAQNYKVGSGPGTAIGGTNPTQVGLGVNLGSIDTIMNQGSMLTTGKTTDLAIQGQGFFTLGEYDSTSGAATAGYYTRDGAFALDSAGYLVDPVSGYYVLGYLLNPLGTVGTDDYRDPEDPATTSGTAILGRIKIDPGAQGWASYNIGSDGKITGVLSDGTMDDDYRPQVVLSRFANPEGLLRGQVGSNVFQTGANSGAPTVGVPSASGMGSIMSSTLENSNVDLAEQFSRMIMAERGFQANSRIITASDEMLQDLVNMKR